MDELNADENITDNLPRKSAARGRNQRPSLVAASRDLVFAIKLVPFRRFTRVRRHCE